MIEMLAGLIVFAVATAWLIDAPAPRRRFDGYTSGNDGDLKPLDSLTKAEREEIGAAWAVDMRGDE